MGLKLILDGSERRELPTQMGGPGILKHEDGTAPNSDAPTVLVKAITSNKLDQFGINKSSAGCQSIMFCPSHIPNILHVLVPRSVDLEAGQHRLLTCHVA